MNRQEEDLNELHHIINELNYPITREEIYKYLNDNNYSKERILSIFDHVPVGQFKSPGELQEAINSLGIDQGDSDM